MQLDIFGQIPERRPTLNIRKPPPKPATAQPPAATAPPIENPIALAPPKRVPTIRFPTHPHQAAFDLAEATIAAWHKAGGDHRFDIAIGAVAGVALWPLKGREVAPLVADWWRTLSQSDTLTALEECYARWWISRPDLIETARPVHEWLTEQAQRKKYAVPVHAAVRASLDAGLLDLLGGDDPDYRSATDVLGFLLTGFRSTGQRDVLAEFHTPPEVCELMARMLLDGGGPAESFDDPAAGTGGMHRAAALIIRERGLNPAAFTWSMTDIDPIAAACCAINAIIWDLGPNVLVWCGDTLAEGDGPQRAARRRREVIAHRDEQVRYAKMMVAIEGLLRGPLAA